MAAYTIVIQLGKDPETASAVVEADSFAQAKAQAFDLFARCGAESGYVAIGRGEGDNVEWIGAFDFAPGKEPRWEAAD